MVCICSDARKICTEAEKSNVALAAAREGGSWPGAGLEAGIGASKYITDFGKGTRQKRRTSVSSYNYVSVEER